MAAGSDAAKQVAHIVLLDSDFVHLKEIVSRRPYDYLQHRESELSVSDKDDLFIAVNVILSIGTFLSVCADSSDTDQYGGHRYSKFYSGIRTDRDCDPERLPEACASSRTAGSFDYGAEYAADSGNFYCTWV